jgi:hypothetical protein
MTGRAIDIVFDVNPVGEHNVFWKLIHPLPGNLFACLHIVDHFQRLGPPTDRIGRVAGPAELYVRNPCDAIFAGISMAKIALQFGDFLMANMVVADRLIDGFTS